MAIQTLTTIKNWFRTGLKPTQTQFWDTWDSFRHKSEKVPIVDIDGIDELLQNKTEIEAFENHLTNPDAHIDLFNSKVEKSQFDAHTIDFAAHEDLFNSKAEKSQFDGHIIDPNAHEDLFNSKEDKSQKGAQNGYAPLNDFAKLASEYLDIVNDVVSGGTTSVLSAEQGKLIQNRIDAINTILTSDNVNLDTVQELVDAIESVQLSLNSILVNDLTTGGTTKGLTAEMGKLLQTNKVDKVAGERLINAAEIAKLSGLTNVTTTIKTILSTALATQNIAGFVTYINALSPVLVVGPNEIIKYTTSDTGRTFELNLRGRSFGVGQPAIVAANVIEVTEFLNKDIKLSNYPNTRNDGQLPTNKVLSTDVNGNLRLYTIAMFPPPHMEILIPDNTLTSTTTNFKIRGAFFTQTMTVSIVGQTVNYVTFISDNEVRVNVTTGATDGNYAVTLNNGLSATFPNVLFLTSGTIYKPTSTDWTISSGSPDLSIEGEYHIGLYGATHTVKWNRPFDFTRNFQVLFKFKRSPLGNMADEWGQGSFGSLVAGLVNNAGTTGYSLQVYGSLFCYHMASSGTSTGNLFYQASGTAVEKGVFFETQTIAYKWIDGVMYLYVNNFLKTTYSLAVAENLFFKIRSKFTDVVDIKYVELP